MTDSSQQDYFLEQFQQVHDLLDGGEVREALEQLVDLREAGFVNPELDATIDSLRGGADVGQTEAALEWVDEVRERLSRFGGDVFELVEELSEVSVGLTEAQWDSVAQDDADESWVPVEFEEVDDSEFDIDIEEVDDTAFGMEFGSDDAVMVDANAGDDRPGSGGDEADCDEADSEDVEQGGVDDKVDGGESMVDFALIENSGLQPSADHDDAVGSSGSETTAASPTAASPGTPPDEPADGSESWADESGAGSELSESSSVDDNDDEFDFDLGFENPDSRTQTPGDERTSVAADDAEPQESAASGDEFDFDLGFENPESRSETSGDGSSVADAQPDDSTGADDPFDFDLGLQNPNGDHTQPGDHGLGERSDAQQNDPDAHKAPTNKYAAVDNSSTNLDDDDGRSLRTTPTSVPAIPRFQSPSPQDDSGEEADEDGERAQNAADSLEDDDFFELAESLASDSSPSGSRQAYRGEPLMNPSRTPTPSPSSTPLPTDDGADESGGRQRADTPNPFAQQAPTGVQKALVDSHSSFVLEEIRDSEAREERAAAGSLMEEAQRLYEKGQFESAHDLLDVLIGGNDASDEAAELLETVEGELARLYQSRLGSLSKRPELNVDMSQISSMNLDHRYGFLLSQIDGLSSFEDILEISSMSRVETLEVLAEMAQRDMITVS